MKMLAVVLFMAVAVAPERSEPPSPGAGESDQPEKQQSAPAKTESKEDKRGTEEMPLVVSPLEVRSVAVRSAEEHQQEAEDRQAQASANRWTLLFNGLIAIFTALLTYVTWQSHRTAKFAAEAIPNIERAYLFGSVEYADEAIVISVKNHGRTPAVIIDIDRWIEWSKLIDDVPQTFPRGREREFPRGLVLGPSESRTLMVDNRPLMPEANDGERVFAMGRVRYRDIMDIERETGFCWDWRPKKRNFHPVDSPLNYHT